MTVVGKAPPMRSRQGTAADLQLLAALYARSARGIGPARYSEQQVAVWSSFGEDLPALAAWLDGSGVLVALGANDELIGFCAVDDDGHVRGLYLEPDHAGAGLGLWLLQAALSRARPRGVVAFHAEATVFSRRVFERAGFGLDAVERSEHRGVAFERFRLSCSA